MACKRRKQEQTGVESQGLNFRSPEQQATQARDMSAAPRQDNRAGNGQREDGCKEGQGPFRHQPRTEKG